MSERRTRHDIITDVLKFTLQPQLKTHIMNQVGLKFDQLERYLKALNDKGFLQRVGRKYVTTEKGRHVIEACDLCLELCREEP